MLYSHEHRPLDKERIALDIPQAVAALRAMFVMVLSLEYFFDNYNSAIAGFNG